MNLEQLIERSPDAETLALWLEKVPYAAYLGIQAEVDADDILFGGWGNDFVHGGSGDDAISGAEALPALFASPVNGGDILGFGVQRDGEFAAYDEFEPFRKVFVDADGTFTYDDTNNPFVLNFEATEGQSAYGSISDGDDRLFGDLGNDWIVGGTGRDHGHGGWNDDRSFSGPHPDSGNDTHFRAENRGGVVHRFVIGTFHGFPD